MRFSPPRPTRAMCRSRRRAAIPRGGLDWTACVKADLTSVNGKPLGAQTYRVTISAGAIIDRYYYCTDLKGSGSTRRKPQPGMIFEAAEELGLDLEKTVFVGDSATDMTAARGAGVGHAVLVLTGATNADAARGLWPAPDFTADTLSDAVDWILEEYK